MIVYKDVMVPMRDGIRLATDIYRPAVNGELAEGPFPVILGRTSYDKASAWMWVDPVANVFTKHGYAVVLQDIRGRYHSEDIGNYYHTVNPKEGTDGYDTIEWIAKQPWSNGKIGMVGSSHNAIVQQVAALQRPPHLTAIWPDVGPTNIYAHMSREGGAMALQMFGALLMHAYQEVDAPDGARESVEEAMKHLREWVTRAPWKPGFTPLAPFPHLEQTFFDYYYRGCYDDFWNQEVCDQDAHWDRHADIPVTLTGGWFDPFASDIARYFAAMRRQNDSPQRVIIGPWDHDAMRSGVTVVGDVDFGPESAWGPDTLSHEQLRWFDRWLRNNPTGVENDRPVRIFVMGGGDGHRTAAGHLFHGGRWREEEEWPLARTSYQDYFFQPDGKLSTSPPEDRGTAVSFSFDPCSPVPTVGGSVASYYEIFEMSKELQPWSRPYIPWSARMRNIVPAGPFHQKEEPWVLGGKPPFLPLATRPDVIVFETPCLAEDVEVTGSVLVHLFISSTVPDTDFTAKLIDVYPPSSDYPEGYHMALVDSVIRSRYREGWDREVFLEPGYVYEVTIELPPISNLFKQGHRLRIDISSSNFPRFDVNPNTGEPVGRHTFTRVARNTLHVNQEHSSRAIIPIILSRT